MAGHKSLDTCTKRVIRLLVTVFFLVVFFVPSLVNSTITSTASSSSSTPAIQYCSFFSNRAPSPQPGLKNCTWFKSNSCCLQEEISATFGRVKPLPGADKNCQNFLNYLMCYICAPDQNTFYLRERLTVCREFCNTFYDACRTAVLKGSIIGDLYSNGSQFCLSRSFKVDDAANGRCFNHAIKQKKSGAVTLKTYPPFFRIIITSLLIYFSSGLMDLEPPPLLVWERWSFWGVWS